MTYKQAQAQGWQVSAGEKSTRIQHWVWEEEQARLDKNGKPLLDEKGNVSKETVRLERPKSDSGDGIQRRANRGDLYP